MLLSPSALSSWTTSLPPLETLRAELAVAVLLLTFPWETLSRSSSYCTTPALPWATSKNSVSPAFISIVSHWVGLGLQVPSPFAVASEETRKTAVLWSDRTPRKMKNGSVVDGSGVSLGMSWRTFWLPIAQTRRLPPQAPDRRVLGPARARHDRRHAGPGRKAEAH